jgi:alcohol dehydrogenase class IV
MAIELALNTKGTIVFVVDTAISNFSRVQDALKLFSGRSHLIYTVSGAPIAQDVENFSGQIGLPPAAVVSIGGGSSSDFAKAIISKFIFGKIDGVGLSGAESIGAVTHTKPILICIPTTAGSGAEASRYFVTYDSVDRHKVFGKSWLLVADWIMLDPFFLKSVPDSVLVECAFDTFVHLFETLICRYESSNAGEMLSLFGIPKIMNALHQIFVERDYSDHNYIDLMEMSTFGGVAISNIRTGNIHEAAGALLELTALNHSETLFVFFRAAISQYMDNIQHRERDLIGAMKLKKPFAQMESLENILEWWEMIFHKLEIDSHIKFEIRKLNNSPLESFQHIFNRIYDDKVWIQKESPIRLDSKKIEQLINKSLQNFDFDYTCTVNKQSVKIGARDDDCN